MFQKIEKQFQIESIGFYYDRVFSKDHDFKGERHDFIELVYVCEGSAQIVENENIYTLNNGDFVLHAPMEFHSIRSAENTNPNVYVITSIVEGELPQNLTEGVFGLTQEEQKEYKEIYSRVFDFFNSEERDALEGQGCTDALSAFLIASSRMWRACSSAEPIFFSAIALRMTNPTRTPIRIPTTAPIAPKSISI